MQSVPNANNNIVYDSTTGVIKYRVIGDTSRIVLKANESIIQADVPDLDRYFIDGQGNPTLGNEFTAGSLIDDTYFLTGLPNPTAVFFEGVEYQVTNGNFSVTVNFVGQYVISLRAQGYIPADFFFEYTGIGGIG